MVDPQLDGPQLAALAAVVELGSFDAAAERLHVTPRLSVSASSRWSSRSARCWWSGKSHVGRRPQVSRCCGWPRKQRCSSPRRSLKWVATRR
uniref:HTH-type transcriptional regulator n=1 Tax=Mycobacterium tuberculosis TaxID=1773 RepID=A0A1L6C624_MYCTX|nr:HTH-type transcriptional regulator [Mycobacterium tuberculosis]